MLIVRGKFNNFQLGDSMTQVVFRNMEKSELAVQLVKDRLDEVLDRFPDTSSCRVVATLSSENSPRQAGPDLFRVNVRLERGRFAGVVLEKAAPSLYIALADICEGLLERLNRFGDRARVINRQQARKFANRNS